MDNSYMTVTAEQLLEKEYLQQRHYQLLNELQILAQELPIHYQQRLPYELLSNLANCLLDTAIPLIVNELKDIQHITEKSLFERRMKSIGRLRQMKVEQQKAHRLAINDRTISSEQMIRQQTDLDRYIEDETNKIDMKTIIELDQVVSDQQVTLEKACVPGFYVTNNPIEIQMQIYILQFISRLSDPNNDY